MDTHVFFKRRSGINSDGRHTSRIDFLAHAQYLQLLCLSLHCTPRMQGCSEDKVSRIRSREVGSDSIRQCWEQQRYECCSGWGKLRRRIWGFQRRTMHRQSCLPKTPPSARIGACLQQRLATDLWQFQYSKSVRSVCPQGSCKVRISSAACQFRCRNVCACFLDGICERLVTNNLLRTSPCQVCTTVVTTLCARLAIRIVS